MKGFLSVVCMALAVCVLLIAPAEACAQTCVNGQCFSAPMIQATIPAQPAPVIVLNESAPIPIPDPRFTPVTFCHNQPVFIQPQRCAQPACCVSQCHPMRYRGRCSGSVGVSLHWGRSAYALWH